MVINKKIKRTIMQNKGQYFGSIILIIISCMMFSMFNIPGDSIIENLHKFKKAFNIEDAHFITQNKINNISNLEEKFNLKLEERKSFDYKLNNSTTLRILRETQKVNKYVVIKGKDFENKFEILLDQTFAKANNLNIGENIKIKNKNFKIVGFMSLPDYVYPVKHENDLFKNPDTFGVSLVSSNTFKYFDNSLTFYSVRFNENNKSEFQNYLTQNNFLMKWVDKQDNYRITFVEGDLKALGPMGKTLPIFILILTCVLVSVVLWRLLKREFVEIGTLYALGYSKKQILKHYLMYSIIISLTGSIIGTLLGILLIKPFISYMLTFYNLPLLELEYSFMYLIISLILPFIFLIPVTMFVVNKALKLSPVQLMRGEGHKVKINFLERKLNLNNFKFETKFKIREIIRNIPRTVLMILGVTFASMLLLIGFGSKDSFDYLAQKNLFDLYDYKYDYVFKSLQTDKPEHGEVLSFSPFTTSKLDDKNFVIYGIQKDAQLINLTDKQDNLLDLNQVIASKTIANKLNLQAGDSITVKNKLNSKKFKIKIDAIAQVFLGDTIYMPIDKFNSLNGYPEGSYMEIYSDQKLNIDENKLISVRDKQDMLGSYKALIKPVKYMIGIIALIAFAIGLIVIYIVTAMMIEENKYNISLLKIFGYNKKKIYSLILNSNTILVILGYILSLPLITISLGRFFDATTKKMNLTIPVKFNSLSILIGFIIIYFTYEISKLLVRRKIINIPMDESLKNKFE